MAACAGAAGSRVPGGVASGLQGPVGSNPSLLSTGAIVWTMEVLGRVIAGLLSEPETQHLAHFEVRDGWGDVLVCACVDTLEPADNKAHAHLAAFQKRKPRGEGGGGDISGKC